MKPRAHERTAARSMSSSSSPCTISQGQSGRGTGSVMMRPTGGAIVTSFARSGTACRGLQCRRGTERKAAEPQRIAVELPARPFDHGQRIREFTHAVVVLAFAGTHATEIEAHRGRARFLHRPGGGVHDLVLHRAAVQRMRMADDADHIAGRPCLERIFDARFDGTGGTGDLDGLRHGWTKRVGGIDRIFRQWRLPASAMTAAQCARTLPVRCRAMAESAAIEPRSDPPCTCCHRASFTASASRKSSRSVRPTRRSTSA